MLVLHRRVYRKGQLSWISSLNLCWIVFSRVISLQQPTWSIILKNKYRNILKMIFALAFYKIRLDFLLGYSLTTIS